VARRNRHTGFATSPRTRPGRPGPVDDDLPDHDRETLVRLFARRIPDWTALEAVLEFAAAGARVLGNDSERGRADAMLTL